MKNLVWILIINTIVLSLFVYVSYFKVDINVVEWRKDENCVIIPHDHRVNRSIFKGGENPLKRKDCWSPDSLSHYLSNEHANMLIEISKKERDISFILRKYK